MDALDKLSILSDAAKYDVACTSSGVKRDNGGKLGNSTLGGLCHSFAADGRCISLLKVLMTNVCVYDCKYCINRRSNDLPRAAFTPRELADLTIQFYRRNYIEGLFLSSGVIKNADFTTERMLETLLILREEYQFWGYIHVKAIPGADEQLTAQLGMLADRISINIELPSEVSLRALAPDKTRERILQPMGMIRDQILGTASRGAGILEARGHLSGLVGPNRPTAPTLGAGSGGGTGAATGSALLDAPGVANSGNSIRLAGREIGGWRGSGGRFAPAGQSTQMIIGATPDTDFQILRLTQGLYRKYNLKRVFFSAYIPTSEDAALPALTTKPPLLREHRLYQADWLLRFYGFAADELLDEQHQSFHPLIDPKCNWAINHMDMFPVEVNRAPYELLLRVPGVGVKSAQRIVAARRHSTLDFEGLRRIGVVLKRAQYFLLCSGRMADGLRVTQDGVLRALISKQDREVALLPQGAPEQLSLFSRQPDPMEAIACVTGQL